MNLVIRVRPNPRLDLGPVVALTITGPSCLGHQPIVMAT
jgi:hypothetical protein